LQSDEVGEFLDNLALKSISKIIKQKIYHSRVKEPEVAGGESIEESVKASAE